MMDIDNSFECPDAKKEGVWYRRDTVEVLHEKFVAEAMVDCSMWTLTRYIPSNVVKPKPQDLGTSLCKLCLNPELKVESLREPGVNLIWLLGLDKKQLKDLLRSTAQMSRSPKNSGSQSGLQKPRLRRFLRTNKKFRSTRKHTEFLRLSVHKRRRNS